MNLFILLQLLFYLCFFSVESLAGGGDVSGISDNNRWQVSIGHLNQRMSTEEKDISDGSLTPEKKMTGDNLAFYFGIVKNVNQYFEWLVSLGYETLSVSSKDSSTFCPSSSSESCYVDINYLTLELIPRLKFGTATFQFWSGLGLNVKQPLNKKASAILDDQIQATSTLGLAIGMDYFIDQNLFLPLEFQQQYFLNSEAVKVQQFLMKIGLGRTF